MHIFISAFTVDHVAIFVLFSKATKVYMFRALAFGLNVSPCVFTRMLKTVLRHVRRLGIPVNSYLDDWLQPSVSETLSWLHSRRLLKIILDLGFIPNWEKSELVPVQDFVSWGPDSSWLKHLSAHLRTTLPLFYRL